MRAVIRVTNRVVDFEIPDIILYRAITNKELLNTFNRGIDLIIIEYTKGDNLDYLKDIEKDKIVLVTNDSDVVLDDYKIISPAKGLIDYIKGLVKTTNIIEDYKETISKLKLDLRRISLEKDNIEGRLSNTEHENDVFKQNIERIAELELQVKECIKIRDSLQSELDILNKQIEIVKAHGNEADSIIVKLNEKVKSLESKVCGLTENAIALQDTIIQLYQENCEFMSTIEKVNSDLELINMEKDKLNNQIDELIQDKMISDLEISDLRQSNEIKDSEFVALNSKVSEVKELLSNLIVKYITINEGEQIDVRRIVEVIDKLEEDKKVHEEELILLRERSSELSSNSYELTEEISNLKKSVVEYEEKLKECQEELELINAKNSSEMLSVANERDNLKRQLELDTQEIEYLKENQKSLSESISLKDSRISELLKENTQIDFYKSRVKGLEDVETSLTIRVKEYLKDRMELTELVSSKDSEITKLNDELSYYKSKSNENIKAVVRSVIGNYTGKAKVIPVFGTGSYGITTTALSLADIMRTHKVLVMDFDLVSPKIDAYYKLNPTCSLEDIPQIEMRTGVGALVFRGSEYICNNLGNIIKTVSSNLDYFGGLYYGINGNRFTSIDFELLMNKLGSIYDYIIIDCGKIGCSVYSDTLIKTMHTIAHKSIIVSLNDTFDTRSAFLRLNNIGINMKDSVWVLNMSRQSMVDKNSVKYCGGSKQIVFTKELNIYGEYKLYDRVPNLRSKLAELKKIIG